MTDWGVHLLDYALLGMQVANPKSISTAGGKFAKPDSADETPDTMMAIYEFDGFNIIWDHAVGIGNGNYGKDHGIAFIGNNGTLVLNRGGWEVLEEKKKETKVSVPFQKQSDNGLDKHMVNWVNVIKSRNLKDLNCPIQAGADIAILSQLGNIAYRSDRKLQWNGTTKTFADEAINKKYLTKEYHNGYVLPKL
jgi:predicted dehydrogenase